MIDSCNFMANSPPYQNLNEDNGSFLPGRRYMIILIRRSTNVIGNLVNTSAMERLLSCLCSHFVTVSMGAPSKARIAKSILRTRSSYTIGNGLITSRPTHFQHSWSKIISVFHASPPYLTTALLHLIQGNTERGSLSVSQNSCPQQAFGPANWL